LHSVATGIAKIATDTAGVPVIVRPHSGSSTHLPMLQTGELDLAIHPAVVAGMAFLGQERLLISGKNPFPATPGLRLVMSGSPLLAGVLVRKDSPIRTVADIKGQRYAGEFPAGLGAFINAYAYLRGSDLDWEDVDVVPFASLNDALDGLVRGRVDATVYGIGAPRVREADSSVGVRFINADCSDEGKARIAASAPTYYTITLKADSMPGIVEDTCITAFPIYLMASDKTSDAIVSAVLAGLWEKEEELRTLNPGLRGWARATAAPNNPGIPYHPAAIEFFKSVGVWTAEAEAEHERLLAYEQN